MPSALNVMLSIFGNIVGFSLTKCDTQVL